MAAKASSNQSNGAPSIKERIQALYNHSQLFEMIAECPQIGIHDTFSRELALCLAYAESEVHYRRRVVEYFLQKNANNEEPIPSEVEFRSVMNDLVNAILLYERVVEASRKMNSSPLPSKASMNRYRINSLVDTPGMRGANGEMASMYDQVGKPIPSNLAAVDGDDLSPMAYFIVEWILNPLIDFIATPSQDLLMRLPMYRRRHQEKEKNSNGRIINKETVEAAANAFVYVLAILILIAPIATFNVVKEQSLRIFIMPLFCLLLAASAQMMGSDTMHSYTIVIGYFQAMVVYVGTSNDG